MKNRMLQWSVAMVLVLTILSCVSAGNTLSTYAYQSKSAWTAAPTYTVYPTYTVRPPSIQEATRIVVVTNTHLPTATKTDWREPTEHYTPLPTVDVSNVPQFIIDSAVVTGMDAYEVVYMYNLIINVAKNRDPYPLLDFLRFPLQETGKCPGDVIETPEEFVSRFPTIVNESTRANILNIKMEDIFLSWRGMAMAANSRYDIWIVPYCADAECAANFIILGTFIKYSIFWEMVEGNPGATPC